MMYINMTYKKMIVNHKKVTHSLRIDDTILVALSGGNVIRALEFRGEGVK